MEVPLIDFEEIGLLKLLYIVLSLKVVDVFHNKVVFGVYEFELNPKIISNILAVLSNSLNGKNLRYSLKKIFQMIDKELNHSGKYFIVKHPENQTELA